MARIPDDKIERIKQTVPIERLCGRYDIELKAQGKNLVGRCPFHKDDTPSFIVTPEKNLWHCMGACSEGGNVFNLVMKAEKVSFRKAFAILFKIGFADRSLGYLIPPQTSAVGRRLKKRLQDLGVYRKNGHEHLRGCVVFPITDLAGQTVQLYGRRIADNPAGGTPAHLYLGGPLRGVWNMQAVIHQKTWVLCEAIIDALTLWCHGVRNVTTCFGKNTFTDELWQLLDQGRPDKVLIAFDGDAAGNQAAEKLAPQLAEHGAVVHRIELPAGRDINEYVCALVQKNPKAVAGALEGLMVDAPILARPAPPKARASAAKEAENRNDSSSLAADLAAKEKTAVKEEKAAYPRLPADDGPPETDTAPALPQSSPGPDLPAVRKGQNGHINIGDRTWRIRGLARNQSFDVMKVNLRVMAANLYHVDNLDLYCAWHRTAFLNTAAAELQLKAEIIKRDIGKVLLKLEQLQDDQIKKALEPKETVQHSAMTGQSLFYFGNKNLKHKILAIVEEEGARHAAYALKLLQSEGKLTIASTHFNGKSIKSSPRWP